MHNSLSRVFAIVPLIALAVACPDCNDVPPGDDAGPDATDPVARELCVAVSIGNDNMFYAALHSLTRCSVDDEWPEVDATTRQAIADSCVAGNELYDIFTVALAGGRVDISIERVRSCVAKAAAARTAVNPYAYNAGDNAIVDLFADADCDGAATPLQADGDTCVQSWDCPDDLACQASPPDSPTLRCLAPAAESQQCGGTRVCADGLSCINDVCLGPFARGANCVTGNENGTRPCAPADFCDSAASGVCQPRKPVDAACASATECEDGLSCPQATLVCSAPVPGVATGQACDTTTDACESYCAVCRAASAGAPTTCLDRAASGGYCAETNDCRSGLTCDTATSACVPEQVQTGPLPDLGDACGVGDVPFECAEGECVLSVCTAGVEDDVCEPDFSACQVGLVCQPDAADATRGACVPEPALGDFCIEGVCGIGAYCSAEGTCQSMRGTGQSCGGDDECTSGACLTSTNTCAAPGPSCYTSRGLFTQLLTLALLLPFFSRLRRRTRRA